MTNVLLSSKVKELQTMLFPIQPICGAALTNLQGAQESHMLQLGRCKFTKENEECSVLLGTTKYRQSINALYALQSMQCLTESIVEEAARWPTECQVISGRIRHIEHSPTTAEPFYASTGKEPTPKLLGDEFGTIIFHYCPVSATNYFSRSCVGGSPASPVPKKCCTELGDRLKNADDNSIFFLAEKNEDLRFESRFESGNLGKVVKITDTYYQLYLRRDLYTQRHTQWYYFQISNTRSKITYRLSIVNMSKEDSLYNEGLKPLLYSTEDARTKSIGWRRCGDNITYYKNGDSSDEEKESHTLTFNVSFPHDHDTVYLAHCYPYTYTDLQEYLTKIASDPIKTRFTKLRLLCRTLAGNGVYYLTITAPTYDVEVKRKRAVVITARVHPGETPSSWTMKGIIDFLTGESNQAKELRERFVFKLVPMLNPDGVIVGNNRCSLAGKDLNRQYRTVMRESYPSIWHTKLMIRRLLEECGITIYCDLHAHSKKHNIFVYGCESKRIACNAKLAEQVFPLMLHKNSADKFSFESCKFHIEKGKEGTGRVVVWSMGVQNSYTMEASMGGSKMGSRSGTHFSTHDYEQLGKAFCETLLDFSDQDPAKENLRLKILAKLLKEGSSAEEPTNIDLTDYSSDEGDTSESFTSDEFLNDDYNAKEICAPPPTPSFSNAKGTRTTKTITRNKAREKKYSGYRKISQRRAVMDLHRTDPGTDLHYMTDWIDEATSVRIGSHEKKRNVNTRISEKYVTEIQDHSAKYSILPAIIRPRSVSLGENLLAEECNQKQEQVHCHHLSREWKYPYVTTLMNENAKVQLTSLKQRIWMGTSLHNDQQNVNNDLTRIPLSWGMSKIAQGRDNTREKMLLSYFKENSKLRQSKKKLRKKQNSITDAIQPIIKDIRLKEEKNVTTKCSQSKWKMSIDLNSAVKNIHDVKPAVLTVRTDSLQLLIDSEQKQQKLNVRNKFYRDVASTSRNILAKSKIAKMQQLQRQLQELRSLVTLTSDSSSSEEVSSNTHKLKYSKKKQKGKRQSKKTKGSTAARSIKCATNAKT